jgi:hypothetical protein
VLAAVDGAQQEVVAERPPGRGVDEVDLTQLLGAAPDPRPAPPAVAGGQDGARANCPDDPGVADGLDGVQPLDAAQREGGGRRGWLWLGGFEGSEAVVDGNGVADWTAAEWAVQPVTAMAAANMIAMTVRIGRMASSPGAA